MQTESMNGAAEISSQGIIANALLGQMERTASTAPDDGSPDEYALRGLIFAIPISLSLWGVLGLIVWAMVR